MMTVTAVATLKKFEKVPQEAMHEFAAADAGLRQGYVHFLNGFKLAVEGVAKEFGGFDEIKAPRDQKEIFKIVKAAARQAMKLSSSTFERYCKIARYCIIYHADWDMASDATRDDLRWCQIRIKSFKNGTKEEKMRRAWDERVKINAAAAKKKEEDEAAILEENDSSESNDNKTAQLINIPLPKVEEDEDSYWIKYLDAQVKHIQKHMDMLNGNSEVKTVITSFYGAALPIVKKNKPKKSEAA